MPRPVQQRKVTQKLKMSSTLTERRQSLKRVAVRSRFGHGISSSIPLKPCPRCVAYPVFNSAFYHAENTSRKFGTDAWDRVVCVMTTGQQWQFRPYKWSEPRVLFHHGENVFPPPRISTLMPFLVKGVHVAWSNDPPNPKIKDWNVTELKVSVGPSPCILKSNAW